MTNTTVVPHLSGILRSSPFQQGVARYSPTKSALEEVCQFQKYGTLEKVDLRHSRSTGTCSSQCIGMRYTQSGTLNPDQPMRACPPPRACAGFRTRTSINTHTSTPSLRACSCPSCFSLPPSSPFVVSSCIYAGAALGTLAGSCGDFGRHPRPSSAPSKSRLRPSCAF